MASVTKIKDQTTCTICQSTFKSPLQLPCRHSYCIECISTITKEENSIACPQCNIICSKLECKHDTNAEKLIELYASCTKGGRRESLPQQSNTKHKFHLPTRSSSKKEQISEKMFTGNKSEAVVNTSSKTILPILTKSNQRKSISSSTSSESNDSERNPCDICIKHSVKWSCMKCKFKSCEACRINFPLKCKDNTDDHIFVEADEDVVMTSHETEDSDEIENKTDLDENMNANASRKLDIVEPPPKKDYGQNTDKIKKIASMNNDSINRRMKHVTFPDVENNQTESSSDSIFKPNYRDSIALTKDKKTQLQDITDEVAKIEKAGERQTDVLDQYHQYMKEVKLSGFSLIDQTEQIMLETVTQFFNNIRKDYETGFDEITSKSRRIQDELQKDLGKVQHKAGILEEIVENNDTRVMQDEEFLTRHCDELDKDVTNLGRNILECNKMGLKESREWDDENKLKFEQQMNVRIITATQDEMNQQLIPEMRTKIDKMKPAVKIDDQMFSIARKKKIFECTIC